MLDGYIHPYFNDIQLVWLPGKFSTTNQRIQAAEYNESGKALGRLDWMEGWKDLQEIGGVDRWGSLSGYTPWN